MTVRCAGMINPRPCVGTECAHWSKDGHMGGEGRIYIRGWFGDLSLSLFCCAGVQAYGDALRAPFFVVLKPSCFIVAKVLSPSLYVAGKSA